MTGRPMAEFWGLTLREVDLVMQGYAENIRGQQNLAYYTAYHAGFFSQRHKKFPDYQKFAPRDNKPKPRQTQEELRRNVMIMVAAFGGKVPKNG